jgi:acyl-CoA thioesterase
MKSIPFLNEIGLEMVHAEGGQSELVLDLAHKHGNSRGELHGGVTMTLLDVCMSRAAKSLDADTTGSATVEMKISFFQPGGQEGQRVIAKGRVLHQSKTMSFCEGEIWNGERLVAKALGTIKVFRGHR